MTDETATGFQNNMRLIQETVPGKQITPAHVIANPDPVIYRKPGMDPKPDYTGAAIGIVTQIDLPEGDPERAARGLRLAGCEKSFFVSAKRGDGLAERMAYLEEDGQAGAPGRKTKT